MPTPTPGIHHVTAMASDPVANLSFYTETLGMRLIKRSINQDDPTVYHLFYGDHRGSPGTSLTFFPDGQTPPGRIGAGQVSVTQLLIPADATAWWVDRLDELDVPHEGPEERYDETAISLRDPDGLALELVGREGVPDGHPPDGSVPPGKAIRGFHGVTLSVQDGEEVIDLLDRFGFERVAEDDGRHRFTATGELGRVVDVREHPESPMGRPGAGTVHHVAFSVEEDEQTDWRSLLKDAGLRPTEIIDRKWFKSVYARTRSGILFEFATPSPGYTVDEPLEALGSSLMLPEWLEDRRDDIESALPELPV